VVGVLLPLVEPHSGRQFRWFAWLAAEAIGELGPVREGTELAFTERVVVARVGSAVALGDAEENATGLSVIGEPRSAWMVSWSRATST
jgi:hypothetical protein